MRPKGGASRHAHGPGTRGSVQSRQALSSSAGVDRDLAPGAYRQHMVEGEVRTLIARPPADVFRVISDVRLNPKWSPSSVAGQLLTLEPVGVGTRALETTVVMGRRVTVTSEITAFEADRHLSYRTSGGPFPFSGSFSTEPHDAGTDLTATFQTTLPRGLSIFAPLFRALIRRQLGASIINLARVMEAGDL